jgi:anti-anti-sigma factor
MILASEFEYSITTQKSVTVIKFTGTLNGKAREQLRDCQKQLMDLSSRQMIILFSGVPNVESSIYRELIQLQNLIRNQERVLKLVGLSGRTKQTLSDHGVIKVSEISPSLKAALGVT